MNAEQITNTVSLLFGVDRAALFGNSRILRIVRARYALAWGLRRLDWTVEAIGDYLGRDHTTIIYGLTRIANDPKLAELERRITMPTQPTIVCLCGSTRFYKDFMEQNYLETMAGRIVLSVGFYPHAAAEMHGEGVGITPEQKEELDQLHLRKVELADEVFVLNRGGYIGSSTARELAHARSLGKKIRFLEEAHP